MKITIEFKEKTKESSCYVCNLFQHEPKCLLLGSEPVPKKSDSDYQLDDQVWVMHRNRPQRGTIKEITLRRERSLLGSLYTLTSYQVELPFDELEYFGSHKIYRSKEALLNALYTGADDPIDPMLKLRWKL